MRKEALLRLAAFPWKLPGLTVPDALQTLPQLLPSEVKSRESLPHTHLLPSLVSGSCKQKAGGVVWHIKTLLCQAVSLWKKVKVGSS